MNTGQKSFWLGLIRTFTQIAQYGTLNMAEILRITGTIAGIAGISLAVVLLIYRDFIRNFIQARIFRTLSSAQATLLIGAVIILTFGIAVLGVYAGFVKDRGPVFFILLVGIILLFAIAVLYILTRRHDLSGTGILPPDDQVYFRAHELLAAGEIEQAERELSKAVDEQQHSADYWYWKARIAFARQNLSVALAYLDEGLKRSIRHAPCLALKIKVLLLQSSKDSRRKAQELATQSSGISDPLDVWLNCLKAEGMFGPGVKSNSELESKCHFPFQDWADYS
jgi:tetratricopeptide (TPR) repeat protein